MHAAYTSATANLMFANRRKPYCVHIAMRLLLPLEATPTNRSRCNLKEQGNNMNNTQFVGAAQKQPSVNATSTPKVAGKPVISISGTQQNELLAAMPRADLEALFEHLELVAMP